MSSCSRSCRRRADGRCRRLADPVSWSCMRCSATVLVLLATSTAMADEVDDLVASGEAFAKSGEYSRAIERFKQADARRPRALHACLIALTYTRRELWAQAEVALASCHARAGGGDPLP